MFNLLLSFPIQEPVENDVDEEEESPDGSPDRSVLFIAFVCAVSIFFATTHTHSDFVSSHTICMCYSVNIFLGLQRKGEEQSLVDRGKISRKHHHHQRSECIVVS